jgi:hypothetical protein
MEGTDRHLFERSLRHALESDTDTGLGAVLDRYGWHEALAEDPRTAVSVLFELQGATDADSSAIAAVLGHGLGLTSLPPDGLLLPMPGPGTPPGTLEGDGLAVGGLLTARPGDAGPTLVVTGAGGGLFMAEVAAGDLVHRSVEGMAPSLGLVEVTGTDVPFTALHDLAEGDWARAVAMARLAIGHELVGASTRMLDLARDHAVHRIQFDRPISSFQAVRHRLADTLVAVEAATAALETAWDDRSPGSAAMAKALAGRAGQTAARHGQQVLAGIGFTTEHELHRSVRRVLVLDELFGTAHALTLDLGRQLLATRQLPPPSPL